MEGKEMFPNKRDERKTFRLGVNRQVELSMKHELDDLAKKSLHDIVVMKGLKQNEPLAEEQKISLMLRPELKAEKPRSHRKTASVFHENLKPREVSKEQFVLVPHVPANSNPDKLAKIAMQSRIRKYPYAKGELITMEELKKPKKSSIGVIPIRSSLDIPDLKVVLGGTKMSVEFDEIELIRNAQSDSVPSLHLEDFSDEVINERTDMDTFGDEPNPKGKPAILTAMGTVSRVTMTERANPPAKPSVMHSKLVAGRKDTLMIPSSLSAAKSSRSVQSSLLSDELVFPDETVFSKYDDVIAAVDDDVETAVGAQYSPKGDSPGIRSVKELLEEAKRISSPGSEPLNKHHPKPPSPVSKRQRTASGRKKSSKQRDGHKSPAKSAAGKTSSNEADGDAERAPTERSVDEIVSALKQQAISRELSEADRKIKEIMERVMSRTGAAFLFDSDDPMLTPTPQMQSANGQVEGKGNGWTSLHPDDKRSTPKILTSLSAEEYISDGVSPDVHLEESTRGNFPQIIQEEDESLHMDGKIGARNMLTDHNIDKILSELQIPEVPPPVQEQTYGVLNMEEQDLDMMNNVSIQQAWQDLMAPPEATYEELVSVVGEQIDLHTRNLPLSATKQQQVKVTEERQEETLSKSIHHFCKVTSKFQLPQMFRNTGRKYHTPDMYAGVFPCQQYRFDVNSVNAMKEEALKRKNNDLVNFEKSISEAAQHIVMEANQLFTEGATVEAWKQKAEELFSQPDMVIEGHHITPCFDESRVYWAPAPPKLEVSPAKVQQILFPNYKSEQFDENDQPGCVPSPESDNESEEEEEESIENLDDKAMTQRILSRKHQSSEDLTQLMIAEIKREKMIHDRELDPHTYRLLLTPPPPGNTPEPKSAKEPITIRSASTKNVKPEKFTYQPSAPSSHYGGGDFVMEKILGPSDDSLFAPIHFPPPRRSRSLPKLLAELDDTLVIPLDFNTAMEEIREQRQLIEKARRQHYNQQAAGDVPENDKELQISPEMSMGEPVHADILHVSHTPKKDDELTPAEKALLAGRNYVILPKRRKKKRLRRPVDMARTEAIEKFLAAPPKRLMRHNSLPKLKRIFDKELRIPQHVRSLRGSLPDVLNFEKYKIYAGVQKESNEREWVRGIWNKWFDEVFPPTPIPGGSDENNYEGPSPVNSGNQDVAMKEDKKNLKEAVPDILAEEIDVIEPLADTEENAIVINILKEEIEKLTSFIDSITPPMAYDLVRRGALYRKLGQLKKAGDDLNRAIKMEPMLLDAYWHRHLLYVLQDKKTAALEDLNFIMKHNKTHAGAYRSMAEIYRKQNDATMAIVNYTQAIKMNPTDHDAYFQRAHMYEQRGEMLLALEDYSKCMKLMPTRTDAIMKHGLYYFENGHWTNAINDFTELLRVDPLNAAARLYRGLARTHQGHWTPAVEDFSAAIHLDPNNWQAFYHRACILRKAHPKQALHDFSVSLLINDGEENLMSCLHRGILYNAMGRPEDAIPDFEGVIKLNKDNACAHVNLGLIYMTQHHNYHRAIRKFSSAITVDPTYVRAYVCRGEAYHKIHELKLALKDFTRAIHLRPDIHNYYMFRGQLVLELGNLDLAAFCVRHASEIGGQDGVSSAFSNSATQQAAVQSFLKNYEKAIDALVQSTRAKPVAPLFILLGKTQMKAKQFQTGAASFEKALELMRPWRQRDPWPPEAAEAHFLSGMCFMELRNYQLAFNSFNSAISLDSNYAEAYYQRGLARMNLKQSKSIQDFNRALAINPNIFQAYLSRACYYGLKGVYTKAILNCNEAIKLQPGSVRAYLYRGALKYHIKAFQLAIIDLTKAASIDSTCSLAYFNRAVCYQESKQYPKALNDYGIVLLLGDQLSLKVLINRGLLYFEQGDYVNALYDFQAAAKLSPTDHCIYHTLGLCLHKLNRLQEAVAIFTQCIKLKSSFLDGLIARGNVYMDYGHEAGILQARKDYERALHLDPMCLAARVNLAYSLQVTGKLMQAWHNFTIVITVRPNFKPALEGRAIVNLQMSNTFAAFQDINASIYIVPTAELLTNRGVISQFMNDRVNAMRDYQLAIEMDPKYSLAYFNAGNVYFHTRHFRQALEYYNKAIENNAKDESAFLNRAITKVLLQDSKSALADFKEAIHLSPHSAHIYFNRASLYVALQQFDKADQDYTKALTLQPDDPLMLKRRADVRGKLGQQEAAIADYRRAIDIQTRPHRILYPEQS